MPKKEVSKKEVSKKEVSKKENCKNELSLYSNFDQIGGDYKSARSEFMKREEKAQKFINDETKEEKDLLDKAIKKYNDKMESIIKTDKFKKIEKEAEQYSQEMNKNLMKAKNTFIKIQEDISKRDDWDSKKKGKKIQELYDYILEKLYTKEEVDQFKKIMNMIMVAPNSKQFDDQVDLIIE